MEMKPNRFVRIKNVLFDPEKVELLQQEEEGSTNKVVIRFDSGSELTTKGPEAAEWWSYFDSDKGWKGED